MELKHRINLINYRKTVLIVNIFISLETKTIMKAFESLTFIIRNVIKMLILVNKHKLLTGTS